MWFYKGSLTFDNLEELCIPKILEMSDFANKINNELKEKSKGK